MDSTEPNALGGDRKHDDSAGDMVMRSPATRRPPRGGTAAVGTDSRDAADRAPAIGDAMALSAIEPVVGLVAVAAAAAALGEPASDVFDLSTDSAGGDMIGIWNHWWYDASGVPGNPGSAACGVVLLPAPLPASKLGALREVGNVRAPPLRGVGTDRADEVDRLPSDAEKGTTASRRGLSTGVKIRESGRTAALHGLGLSSHETFASLVAGGDACETVQPITKTPTAHERRKERNKKKDSSQKRE